MTGESLSIVIKSFEIFLLEHETLKPFFINNLAVTGSFAGFLNLFQVVFAWPSVRFCEKLQQKF